MENNEPIVSDEELKMPEENFGGMPEEQNSSSLGIILAALIIILILLLGGLYLWGYNMKNGLVTPQTSERPTAEENNEPESNNAEAQVETMQALSSSDSVESLEADLGSTDLKDLDADLNAIEAELDASL